MGELTIMRVIFRRTVNDSAGISDEEMSSIDVPTCTERSFQSLTLRGASSAGHRRCC